MLQRKMKKQKIKHLALAAMILVLIFVSYTQLNFVYLKHRLNPIAGQLLHSQSSSEIVSVGGSIVAQLENISSQVGVSWKIQYGDAPAPIGNRKTDACIVYMLDKKDILGLRMLVKWGEVHILGFWTPY